MADRFNVQDTQGGAGSVIGTPIRSTSQFTMTTAATIEDVPTMTYSFVFDGRPVRFFTTGVLTSQDQASAKIITLSIARSSDGADQAVSKRQTDATANSTVSQPGPDTGYFTAWPSDGVALVVGTQYTVKLRLLSGASSKASTNGNTQAYQFIGMTG